MTFKPSAAHVRKLEQLNAVPHITHRHVDRRDVVVCVIRDKVSGDELSRAEVLVSNEEAESQAFESAIDMIERRESRRHAYQQQGNDDAT